MTTTASTIGAAGPNTRRDAVVALARTEARRALRGPALWIGLLVTAWFGSNASGGAGWQAGNYQWFSVAFGPLAAGIFVAGVLAGGRDRRSDDRPALAEEAALENTARTTARLLGLLVLVVIGAVIVVAVAVGIRIEGGLWVGDEPGRTDAAVHGIAEVLQPVLLFVVAAAAGVAAGRAFRRRTPVIIVGIVIFFLFTGAYWMWQASPMIYAVPIQTQPIEVTIDGDAMNPMKFPAEWFLVDPDEPHRGAEWKRTLVSQPLAVAHDVYLIGLVALAVGFALGTGKGRWFMAVGLVVAGLGIAAQVVAMPDNATKVEVPQ